jgi:hypothetical protein
VLPSVKNRPGDPAGVLALQEKGLGLAILESEDLAITADVELALKCVHQHLPIFAFSSYAPSYVQQSSSSDRL